MTVGEAIKKARKSRSYSRWKLSMLSGVSDVTIRVWESGRAKPTIDLLIKVADVLDIGLDELVGRER